MFSYTLKIQLHIIVFTTYLPHVKLVDAYWFLKQEGIGVSWYVLVISMQGHTCNTSKGTSVCVRPDELPAI